LRGAGLPAGESCEALLVNGALLTGAFVAG
jgi:hypothetical protein